MALKRYRNLPRLHTPDRCLLQVALLIGTMLLCLAVSAQGQESDETLDDGWNVPALRPEAAAKVDAVLNTSYQTELPQGPTFVKVARPRAVIPAIFMKIGMILAGLVVLIIVLNIFLGNKRWAQDENRNDEDPTDDGLNPFGLGDPEALAGSGHFAEAIHAMLLRSLVLAARRLDITWPRSLTSREIMGSAALTIPARESLGDLIAHVEIHHFGGRRPQAEDYHHCKQVYERLLADPIKETP